jgi:penicillin amidase
VRGINAYVEATERDPSLLPVEFRALGLRPGRWTPEVVVSRHNGLYRNATQEVQAARLVHLLGEDRARGLLNLHPGRPRLTPDPALDLGSLGDDSLTAYRASRTSIRFRPEDVEPGYRGQPLPEDKPAEKAGAAGIETRGSNNWVLSGERTASGSPIMANDPHRSIDLPSLRYWVHLVAPGWDVIGGGEPALPGVSIGHNPHGAWGFTIFPIDQEDLYVYQTDPADPSRYRYRDGWESMRLERETIPVKGRGEVEVELRFTRHGPVIHEDRARRRAYALRAAWLEEGSAPYLASLRIDQASTWAEFREAATYFRTPSENLVWADRDGHIGWQAVGLAPVRRGWDGLLPVPGDGRYEWDGFLPATVLPFEADPPRGWFASANQDNLPPDYPSALGFQWAEPFRFDRLGEVLGPPRRLGLEDMTRLQQDELLLPARSLVPLLVRLRPAGDQARRARDRLANWDFVMSRDSVPAAIYATWEKAVRAAVWERMVPPEARSILPARQLPLGPMIRRLVKPDAVFGDDPMAGRDALLLGALERTVVELERRLGPEMDRWRFGQSAMKHVTLRHPLGDVVEPGLRAGLNLGPLPRGGSAHTVNSTSDADNQATGASFRIIADAGDWDLSLGTNAPGQSGDPASPHYRDLFAHWAEGGYFPVAYSRPKVESVTEARTLLVPRPTP